MEAANRCPSQTNRAGKTIGVAQRCDGGSFERLCRANESFQRTCGLRSIPENLKTRGPQPHRYTASSSRRRTVHLMASAQRVSSPAARSSWSRRRRDPDISLQYRRCTTPLIAAIAASTAITCHVQIRKRSVFDVDRARPSAKDDEKALMGTGRRLVSLSAPSVRG